MRDLLEIGLERLGLEASPSLCSSYLRYIELLVKWNKTYNLTAIKDPEDMLYRHILDSLSIHSFVKGKNCLDVGSGPGLPGMILALAQPEKHWTLLDSNLKKTRFLRHVKTSLNLENVDIVQSRVETHQDEQGFSTIVCRAFSSLRDFYDGSMHLLDKAGVLLAMKAHVDESELEEVRPVLKNIEISALDIPDTESTRCVVVMSG